MTEETPTAFPWTHGEMTCTGMTLRDYFAAKALPISYKFWMNDDYHPDCSDAEMRAEEDRDDFDRGMKDLIAEDAYEMADAMLKARQA
jgi:hypothetical protein